MGATTGISWTGATWNSWIGCHKKSQGCKNCFMFRDMRRFGGDPNMPRRTSRATFEAPLKWQREIERGDRTGHSRLVFTCSWSDFFIEEADAWRDDAWAIIKACPDLIFQVLTKRTERVAAHVPWTLDPWPNVWLGFSAEDQPTYDERLEEILPVPAAVHFASLEPLLGPIDVRPFEWLADPDVTPWFIVGGESGNRDGDFVARRCDVTWIRSIITQCREAKLALWVKQLGSAAADAENGLAGAYLKVDPDAAGLISRRLRAPHGDDPAEWPEDLRVQEILELPPVRGEGAFTLR